MVELRPRRSKAAVPAEAAQVAETPKFTKPKTPKSSKRKAIDDVSPAATKKSRSVKTPAKSTDTEQPAKEEVEPTPKAKKARTPAKAKETEEAAQKETEKTSVTNSKKDKTPSKPQETEKTPVSKSKKEKTPAKSRDTEEDMLKETEKTPASKSKKEKTPAKAKIAKETPSKGPVQSTSETTGKTPVESKATPKVVSKTTQETPASKGKGGKSSKTPKSAKKSAKKAEAEPEPEPEPVEKEDAVDEATEEAAAPEEDENVFSEQELDEQTKALVQAIDSGDEDEPGAGVVLFAQGQDVGGIPVVSKKEKKAAKKALAAVKEKEDTGVIYVGRLPHGFYEHEMKSYFSQFGPIRNLRVSRNKHTGKAKHFGFIEFEELSTAEIVAKTMDNYLLFGHILKCSVIPKAQVNDDLFKGANKRFKPVPWNKMESKHIERPMLEDKWTRKINKENKRRAARAKELQSLGYEFTAPEAKGVDAAKALTPEDAAGEAIVEAIEAPTEKAAIEAPPAAGDGEGEDAEKEQETTPQPVKRGRGRPAKTPQKKATETPRKTSRRTKA